MKISQNLRFSQQGHLGFSFRFKITGRFPILFLLSFLRSADWVSLHRGARAITRSAISDLLCGLGVIVFLRVLKIGKTLISYTSGKKSLQIFPSRYNPFVLGISTLEPPETWCRPSKFSSRASLLERRPSKCSSRASLLERQHLFIHERDV